MLLKTNAAVRRFGLELGKAVQLDVTFREAGVDIEKKRFSSALTPADQRFDLLKTLSSTSVNMDLTVIF